jgi:hypothetical protein
MNYQTAPVKDESPDVELEIEKSLLGIRGPDRPSPGRRKLDTFFRLAIQIRMR